MTLDFLKLQIAKYKWPIVLSVTTFIVLLAAARKGFVNHTLLDAIFGFILILAIYASIQDALVFFIKNYRNNGLDQIEDWYNDKLNIEELSGSGIFIFKAILVISVLVTTIIGIYPTMFFSDAYIGIYNSQSSIEYNEDEFVTEGANLELHRFQLTWYEDYIELEKSVGKVTIRGESRAYKIEAFRDKKVGKIKVTEDEKSDEISLVSDEFYTKSESETKLTADTIVKNREMVVQLTLDQEVVRQEKGEEFCSGPINVKVVVTYNRKTPFGDEVTVRRTEEILTTIIVDRSSERATSCITINK